MMKTGRRNVFGALNVRTNLIFINSKIEKHTSA